MFASIEVEFSIRSYFPDCRRVGQWKPIRNREDLLKELRFLSEKDIPYKIVTLWNGLVQPVTHLFCERMLWGFNSVGMGLSEKALKG
jgi:hypothetical protein